MVKKITSGKLMQTNIRIMKFLNWWPEENNKDGRTVRSIKQFYPFFHMLCGMSAVVADLIIQLGGESDSFVDITENLTALMPVLGAIYAGICFINNRDQIRQLIKDLDEFEEFGSAELMFQTQKRASLFTKWFIIYGLVGNFCYMAMPLTRTADCREARRRSTYSQNMPCELVTRFRLPFKYEGTWLVYLVATWQFLVCTMISMIILAVTMFIVSLVMHIVAQLKNLRTLIQKKHPLKECIRYHIAIIEFASHCRINFSSTLLLYITITSVEISILLFDIVAAKSVADAIRFGMHLYGWLLLLFIICCYGQQLIDESITIAWEIYSTEWYEEPAKVQKDILLMILRSQKPLLLSAASLRAMSLQSFLGVMSSAYSYFTLLLQVDVQ